MSLNVSRTTQPLRFDTGIGKAGYTEIIEGSGAQAPGRVLLPGSTTVTQALDDIFPTGQDVGTEVMKALVAGNSPSLRTSTGFNAAAHDSLASLRNTGTEASDRAAREIENLLADTDLFDHYRAALLES